MPMANTPASYGSIARLFHWFSAVLILTAIVLALYGEGLPRSTDAEAAHTALIYSLHKTIGIASFATALGRIVWALTQPRPAALYPARRAETYLAAVTHWLLYAALLVMPLSGWLFHATTDGFAPILWPFGQSLPMVPKSTSLSHLFRAIHGGSSKLLYLSIALHVAGALKHAFIDRDGTLARMLTGRAQGAATDQPPPGQTRPAAVALLLWGALIAATALLNPVRPTVSGVGASADAGNWMVETGTLTYAVQSQGSTATGRFSGWTAAITYDQASRTGNLSVTIPLARVDAGLFTPQITGPEFFDTGRFPVARFEGTISGTADQMQATGNLSLHGKTLPLTLPFTLKIAGDIAHVAGQFSLDRRDFAIGSRYVDETTLANLVAVQIDLTAQRRP